MPPQNHRIGARGVVGWLTNRLPPGDRQPLALRARLLAGALLLGTLPLFVALIVLPVRVRSTLAALGHAHLTQVAHDLATLTQNELQRHVETASSLARVESLIDALHRHNAGTLDQPALAAINRQVGSLMQGLAANHYQGMFLCGEDGFIFAGVLRSGETAPYLHLDIRDREYLSQARATLKPVVSDPMQSKIGQVPIIVVTVPVLDARGGFAGVIGLSIEITHLANTISGQKLGQTGYPFAVDRHGVLVAHPDPRRVFSLDLGQTRGAERLAERMVRGETGVENYTSSQGAKKLAAFAPVPVAGWSIAASMEVAEFVAPVRRIRWIILTLIGGCILLAVGVTAVFAVGLDQLKLALAQAQTSESRFRLFARVANETIWDWNPATDELWWSEGMSSVFGYAPGTVEPGGAALYERIPEPRRTQVRQGIDRCRQGGEWAGEHHFRRHDGTLAYVLHRAVAVTDAQGRTVRVIGGMTDISARRAAEEKLAEQAALLDQTRDGILVRDLNQVIQFWNHGAERLYGWRAADAIGRRLDELLCIDPAKFEEAVQAVLRNGEWFGHLAKTTRRGAVLTLDCRWTLLRDEHGRPRSILTIDTDITERKQMEAKFLRAQRLESIGTLAGGIAHDLNNLLSPIVMGVDMLRQSGLSAEGRTVLQCIEQSAHRGANLVRQVLSFARGEEGARVSVHVGYVAREVEAIVRSTFPKNITLRVEIPRDVWLLTADPTQLNQVLMNLCVNARDAMPVGGQLAITAKNVRLDAHFALMNRGITPGPHVLIEVADTGTGIPPAVLERIFEPFFTTKETGKGTGLGLSTVVGITRGHGGTVGVYSEPDQGSVFKVYLPAAIDGRNEAAAVDGDEPLPRGHGELILLVDDETAILDLTRQVLEASGYRVLTACDGAGAFALYHEHRADIALVLTDLMMPVMDGLALIAALRHLDPGVVVVAASGLNDNNNQIKAAEAGLRHFLCKPYTAAALLPTLRAALARPAAPGEATAYGSRRHRCGDGGCTS